MQVERIMKTKRYFSFVGEVWCKEIEGPNMDKLGDILHKASTGDASWDVVIYSHKDNDELVFIEDKYYHEERDWYFGDVLDHTDEAYWESSWYIAHVENFLFNPSVPLDYVVDELMDAILK